MILMMMYCFVQEFSQVLRSHADNLVSSVLTLTKLFLKVWFKHYNHLHNRYLNQFRVWFV